jgi:hypothetical protein
MINCLFAFLFPPPPPSSPYFPNQEVLDAYEDEVRRQRHHIKGNPASLLPTFQLTFPPVAINAARTRIETAWRELNAKQQERDALIAALEALGPGDEGTRSFAFFQSLLPLLNNPR